STLTTRGPEGGRQASRGAPRSPTAEGRHSVRGIGPRLAAGAGADGPLRAAAAAIVAAHAAGAKPGAAGADPGRAAGDGRLCGDLHPVVQAPVRRLADL